MAKTAIRRHHRQRLIRQWDRNHPLRAVELYATNELEWRFMAARVYTKTRQPCSCLYCVSPRRTYGNGLAGKSFQELRHPIEFD